MLLRCLQHSFCLSLPLLDRFLLIYLFIYFFISPQLSSHLYDSKLNKARVNYRWYWYLFAHHLTMFWLTTVSSNWGNMEAKFGNSNKSITDLFSLGFYCPAKPLQSTIHCPTPLHAFMSYPLANSAYLQAMSMQVNSITLRKSLRHWKALHLGRFLAHSS